MRGREEAHLASKDMRNTHLVVIDDVRKMVGGQPVRLAKHKVLDSQRFVANGVVDKVVLRQAFRGALLTKVSS